MQLENGILLLFEQQKGREMCVDSRKMCLFNEIA